MDIQQQKHPVDSQECAFLLSTCLPKKRQPSGYYPVNRIMQPSQLHFYHSTEAARTEAKLKNAAQKPGFLSCLFSPRYNILILPKAIRGEIDGSC